MSSDHKAPGGQPSAIGKYRIIGTLGRGSMGVVYKARDPEIGRIVAVKTLRKIIAAQFQSGEAALERFRIEARSAGNLRHPNIITVFEVNIENDIPYIVMDYVDGVSLDQVLVKHRRIHPLLTLYYLKQLASGLDAAHARGVIHRDIKPSNVIVDREENVYLLDFGVASMSESFSQSPKKDRPEPIMGTPGYMSPEQIMNKDLDCRTDLFSLGVVAFECFTGQRPFAGDNFSEVLGNILNAKPLPLSALVDLPLPLEAEFERALAKDKTMRFETAEAMALAFAKALGKERIEKPVLSAVPGEERGPVRERTVSEWKSLASRASQPQTSREDAPGEAPDGPRHEESEAPRARDAPILMPQPQSGASGEMRDLFITGDSVPGEVFAHVTGSLRGGELVRTSPIIRGLTVLIVVLSLVLGALAVRQVLTPAAPVEEANQPVLPPAALSVLEEQAPEALQPLQVVPVSAGKSVLEMNDKELVSVMVDNNSSEDRKLAALREAEQRRAPGLIEAGAQLIESDSYIVRIETIKMLKSLKDRRAVPLLVTALDDHDPVVRGWAAGALGTLGSRKALAYLSSRLAREEVPKVKEVLRRAIEKINGYPLPPEGQ